jgi:hypothetical protein
MTERRRRERRRVNRPVPFERRASELARRAEDRRRDERVAAEIMVEVETAGQRTYRRTANISMGGVAFHAPIPFRLGARVRLGLRLVGQPRGLGVAGEVVGVDASGRGTRIRFLDPPPEVRAALAAHLELFDMPTQMGDPRRRPPPPLPVRAQVREGVLVLVKASSGVELRLRSSDKVIGRDPSLADLVIEHPTVSRRHAHVTLQDGRHVISDLSSTNGLHFRGQPVRSLVLRDGMIFRLGAVEVQYLVSRTV